MKTSKLHQIQEAILRLAAERNIGSMSLREIGRLVGDSSPQKIKHHIQQLEKKGFLRIDKRRGYAKIDSHGSITGFLKKGKQLLRIPIVGAANCGPAEIFAEENIEGYLRVSTSLIRKRSSEGLFAVRADGYSMNKTKINKKSIDDGDYLIIDSNNQSPKEGDTILSVIDGAANIKRYHEDTENNQVALLSDSTEDFAPIFIGPSDDFLVNGIVIDVIKRPHLGFNI